MNASTLTETQQCDSNWKSISIGDTKYSICASETNGGWKIALTNLIHIWTEELDRRQILEKCEKLNPTLSVEDIDIGQILGQLLKDITKHATKMSTEQIQLRSELEGGIFEFAIDLTRGSAEQLWEEVTMPLCLAAGELRRRETILTSLIKKKDAEISEYKLNGAELLRKHIKTEPFNETLLKKNVPIQNAESCRNTFEVIMELKKDLRIDKRSVKAELGKTCSIESTSNRGNSVKVEVGEHSEEKNINLVMDKQGPSNIEGNLKSETVIEELRNILPKVERNSPPKSPKSITRINKNQTDILKRAQNPLSLQAKRAKKIIYEDIE